MLALESVTKYYGAELVLQDVSVSVGRQTRLGVVGPNGIGKSTLLRIAAGLESPDAGKVVRDPATRIGYLPQELARSDPSFSVREFVKQRTGISKRSKRGCVHYSPRSRLGRTKPRFFSYRLGTPGCWTAGPAWAGRTSTPNWRASWTRGICRTTSSRRRSAL